MLLLSKSQIFDSIKYFFCLLQKKRDYLEILLCFWYARVNFFIVQNDFTSLSLSKHMILTFFYASVMQESILS